MIELEHIIRESEYNGEISKETRDKLLLVIEHGGAHRKYLDLLAKEEKDLKERLKSANGKEKQEIEQKIHDLSNKYLTYTNSGGIEYDMMHKIPNGVSPAYYKKIKEDRKGNGSIRYLEGIEDIDISKKHAIKKKEDKRGLTKSKDDDSLYDYAYGKKMFKKDFGGPQKENSSDKLHSRYKLSGSGPNQKVIRKSPSTLDIVKRDKKRKNDAEHAKLLRDKEKIIKNRELLHEKNLSSKKSKIKDVGNTHNPIKKLTNYRKKYNIAKDYVDAEKRIDRTSNKYIKDILKSRYKKQPESVSNSEFDDELYD